MIEDYRRQARGVGSPIKVETRERYDTLTHVIEITHERTTRVGCIPKLAEFNPSGGISLDFAGACSDRLVRGRQMFAVGYLCAQ